MRTVVCYHGANLTQFYLPVVSLAADLIQASDVAHTMQHWHVYRVRFPFQISFHCFKAVETFVLTWPCTLC